MRLGVNIDHVATLRQARGTSYPDPVDAARICEQSGAGGITAHLREDRRHIQDQDIYRLIEVLSVPLNLEMANAADVVEIALEIRPPEVCLVPERRQELTTEGGLDVIRDGEALTPSVRQLTEAGSEVSLFVDPDLDQIAAAAALGVPCIELHTGTYCEAQGAAADEELERLAAAAQAAHEAGLKVNAGHGISLQTIRGILRIPHLDTLNIGHSIVSHAVTVGIAAATRAMADAIQQEEGGA